MRFIFATVAALTACAAQAETRDITADVWVDNWFTMSANGEVVLEDSVPITTERSFNKETATFSVDLPAVIAIPLCQGCCPLLYFSLIFRWAG